MLHPHFVFESLGYAAAFLLYLILRRRAGDVVSDSSRWAVIAAAIAGGAVGGKILYWSEDPQATFAHWHDPLYLLAGKTIVGGLIGGLFAVEWMKWIIGEKTSTGDLFAAPVALGIAVGRIGCFLTGLSDDTFGTPTSLPWGIDFGDGIRRHPTQLYESLFAILLCIFLLRMFKQPHRNGDNFRMFMVVYMGWRLAIDFLKPEVHLFGLSSIQWACVAMLLYYRRDILRWLLFRGAHESDHEARPLANDATGKVPLS